MGRIVLVALVCKCQASSEGVDKYVAKRIQKYNREESETNIVQSGRLEFLETKINKSKGKINLRLRTNASNILKWQLTDKMRLANCVVKADCVKSLLIPFLWQINFQAAAGITDNRKIIMVAAVISVFWNIILVRNAANINVAKRTIPSFLIRVRAEKTNIAKKYSHNRCSVSKVLSLACLVNI